MMAHQHTQPALMPATAAPASWRRWLIGLAGATGTILALAGLMVISDVALTAAWQEPLTALYARTTQDGLVGDLHRLQAQPGALDARGDSSLVIMGRTGAASITSIEDAIKRARAYEATGVDALFFTGIKSRAELEAIVAATKLPIVLGGAPDVRRRRSRTAPPTETWSDFRRLTRLALCGTIRLERCV